MDTITQPGSTSARRLPVIMVVMTFVTTVALLLGGAGPGTASTNRADAQTPDRPGFLFLDGAYVLPPYTIEAVGGAILVNGSVVRAAPQSPVEPEPPASPATATDLIAVAAARFRALGYTATEETRAELVSLLRSMPATAHVSIDETTLTVRDSAGNEADLFLVAAQPPSAEEVAAARAALAEDWRALLDGGGLLMLSPRASLEVPAGEVPILLNDLMDALSLPSEECSARLAELFGDAAVAATVLAAGPPDLGSRLPPRPDRSAASSQRNSAQDLFNEYRTGFAFVADQPSHQLSRTPKSKNAYMFLIHASPGDDAPVKRAAQLQGYTVYRYDDTACISDPLLIDKPIDKFFATSGKAGILYISTHSNGRDLAMDKYCSADLAKAALERYTATAYGGDGIGGTLEPSEGRVGEAFGEWFVVISGNAIRRQWRDAYTIVHLHTCHGADLANAFNAREFISAATSVLTCRPPGESASLWDRIAGTVDNGTKRNVGDAFAASNYAKQGDERWTLQGFGGGRTVLSPAVVSVDPPPGSRFTVGSDVRAVVTFDAELYTDDAANTVRMTGACDPQKHDSRWLNPRQLEFYWSANQPGGAQGQVRDLYARSADNGAWLDGNQLPAGTDHVGPNGPGARRDEYDDVRDPWIWEYGCDPAPVPTPGTQSPPPASPAPQTAPTPSPSPSPMPTPFRPGQVGSSPSPTPGATQGARLQPDRSMGRPGETVSVTAHGFTPNTNVRVCVVGPGGTCQVELHRGSTGSGTFAFSFSVPNLPPGTYTIDATDGGGVRAAMTFTVR